MLHVNVTSVQVTVYLTKFVTQDTIFKASDLLCHLKSAFNYFMKYFIKLSFVNIS